MKKKARAYRGFITWGLTLLLLLGMVSGVGAKITYPSPTSHKYINDYAGVVSSKDRQAIINLGYELEKQTGAQAVVVTLETLEGIPISDYANGLFREWGIGQGQKDNGLLVLLSIQDKAWRVEVGRGLEGVLPDALTNRVMNTLGKPYFAEGDYSQGMANVYSQFSDEIASEYGVTLTHSLNTVLPADTGKSHMGYKPYLWVLALVLIDMIFNRGRILSFILQMIFWNNVFGGGNRRGGGGSSGGGFGGFGGGSSNGGGSSGGW